MGIGERYRRGRHLPAVIPAEHVTLNAAVAIRAEVNRLVGDDLLSNRLRLHELGRLYRGFFDGGNRSHVFSVSFNCCY